mgnify:CR=1 FL=1
MDHVYWNLPPSVAPVHAPDQHPIAQADYVLPLRLKSPITPFPWRGPEGDLLIADPQETPPPRHAHSACASRKRARVFVAEALCPGQVGAGQVGVSQICLSQVGPTQVGTAQVCAAQVDLAQVCAGQICVTQI